MFSPLRRSHVGSSELRVRRDLQTCFHEQLALHRVSRHPELNFVEEALVCCANFAVDDAYVCWVRFLADLEILARIG
jgi:hypothetical protein